MIKELLSIFLLGAYGSTNTDYSLLEFNNDIISTRQNSLTPDLECNQRKELLKNIQILRLWNANMKLNILFYEKQLKELKIDIKSKIKEYTLSPLKKDKAESLRALVKSFKSILIKRKSKWLVDRVLRDLEKWAKNYCFEITPSEFKYTKKFLEQYRKYLIELTNLCNKCDEESKSQYDSWEYFDFRGFLKDLTDFSLLVKPEESILVSSNRCIQLFELVYMDKFVSCEIN